MNITSTVPQGIADNRSDDPFNEGPTGTVHTLSPWAQSRLRQVRAASERRIAATFQANGISHLNDSCICAECGGCMDSQDLEALQMGVSCVCGEEGGR